MYVVCCMSYRGTNRGNRGTEVGLVLSVARSAGGCEQS